MRRFKPSTPAPARDPADSSAEKAGDDAGDIIGPKTAGKNVEAAAVRLLARREHSVEELSRKLQSKGHDATAVETVVARLRDKKLVSDDRYSSSFVHHRAQRGQGPVRIRAELRQQGITDELIETQLKTADLDWNALAVTARHRKFGGTPPRSMAERAKQGRFLQYRGFSSDQIRAALGGNRSDERLAIGDEMDE